MHTGEVALIVGADGGLGGAAHWIALAMGVYAAVGLAFALWFVFRGVEFMDEAAVGSGTAFRILILPGAAALWPVLFSQWWSKRGRVHD